MLADYAFVIMLVIMVGTTIAGLPIGISMIVSSVFYLLLAGRDVGLASEHVLNGIFDNFVALAVPLFIFAANIMNAGKITDRLLDFALAMVGRLPGGLAQVNILTSLIFSGMSGSAVSDVAGRRQDPGQHDDREEPLPGGFCRRGDGGLRRGRADLPAVHPDGVLRAHLVDLGRRALPRRHGPGAAHLRRARHPGHGHGQDAAASRSRRRFRLRALSGRSFCARCRRCSCRHCCSAASTRAPSRRPRRPRSRPSTRCCWPSSATARSGLKEFFEVVASTARTTAVVTIILGGAFIFNYVVTIEQLPQDIFALLQLLPSVAGDVPARWSTCST